MHFSLASDTILLTEFLALLKKEGPAKTTSMLERGSI
jgi:hypothetical protein